MKSVMLAAFGATFGLLVGCTKSKPSDQPGIPSAPKEAATNVQPKPQALSILVPPSAGTIPYGDSRFVTKWLLLGPFKFAENDFGGDQQQSSLDKQFTPNEAALDGTQRTPEGTGWKLHDFKGGSTVGQVNLDAFYEQPEHAAAYAVAWVECPQDMQVKMLVGSDDYLKVWINGKQVFAYNTERRAGEPDQDVATVELKKGINRIVVKCVDVVLDWNFFLRFATADGSQSIGVKSE